MESSRELRSRETSSHVATARRAALGSLPVESGSCQKHQFQHFAVG